MNFARRDSCNRCHTPRDGGDGRFLLDHKVKFSALLVISG